MTFRQAKSRLRTRVAMQLKEHRWFIPTAGILSAGATAIAILMRADRELVLAAAIFLFATTYLWGYSTRAFRPARWPPTSHFHRREYAGVWDTLAGSPQAAALASSGRR